MFLVFRQLCLRRPDPLSRLKFSRNAVIFNLKRHVANMPQDTENTNVSHSRFLSEAKPGAKWNGEGRPNGVGSLKKEEDGDSENVAEGKGKLSPTSSHLFKLILPLHELHSTNSRSARKEPPTVFLLHPSQPLSHISRLVISSLLPSLLPSAPDTSINISYRSTSPQGKEFQWSDSTDVGDFIRDAARSAEFQIHISVRSPHSSDEEPSIDKVIPITVPTFASRTRFLRWRLQTIQSELTSMESLKRECDKEAHRGARRMAIGGFGMLLVYWGTVARLTFWDYGWDVMEPITYLSGLSTVILGYLWFLYQGREVSYSSILDRSISSRRDALYRAKGLDIERWMDLVAEKKGVVREIERIRGEYEGRRSNGDDEKDRKEKEKESESEGEAHGLD